MDVKRGSIVVGASVAALVAGWFLRRWYLGREHNQELQSSEKVRDFDQAMNQMNKSKATPRKRSANGRHRVPTS